MTAPAVFISYSTPDQATALLVCRALEQENIRCWIAPRDIPAGSNAFAAIPTGLQTVSVMVLILSGKTSNSQYVAREVQLALDYQKHIIPFRIENVKPDGSINFMLTGVQWLDAYMPPVERHIATLVAQISALLSADTESAQMPVNANRRTFPAKAVAGIAAAIVIAGAAFAFLHMRQPAPDDKAIQHAVLAKLEAAFGPQGIKTDCETCTAPVLFVNASVEKGEVLLSGILPSDAADSAKQLARTVDGVKDVSSVVHQPNPSPQGSETVTTRTSQKPAQPTSALPVPTAPVVAEHNTPSAPPPEEASPESLRARAFVMNGQQRMRESNYESARANFEQALNLDPDNKAAQSGLAAAKKALGEP